jgi:hypothetical protein
MLKYIIVILFKWRIQKFGKRGPAPERGGEGATLKIAKNSHIVGLKS